MRAGELRHRITLQRKNAVRDSYGESVPTWITVATVWAQVETTGGSESVDAAQVALASLSYMVTIRYRRDVVPTMRVLWGDRVLEISAVTEPDNRRRLLALLCAEIVDEYPAFPFVVGSSFVGGEDQIT
jgi:SPP1 family predicted phage head-tail adaptor